MWVTDLPYKLMPKVKAQGFKVVADSLNHEDGTWKLEVLEQLFSPSEVAAIRSCSFSQYGGEDKAIWGYGSSRIFLSNQLTMWRFKTILICHNRKPNPALIKVMLSSACAEAHCVHRVLWWANYLGSNSLGLGERPWKVADARLVLEDGSIWRAKSFGASGTQIGEVVFNTSLTGYREILTDPSYAGQFVLMTNPHIGNTGVNFDDEESRQCFLGGLVIRSLVSGITSNWRSTKTLGDYLAERNIMGIYDVDTRAITRRLRQDGSLIGVLSTDEVKSDEELVEMSRTWDIVGVDLISGVSCKAPYHWSDNTDPEWDFNSKGRDGETFHVIAYDFGIKHNILRRLASYGCKITVVPSTWPSSETLKMKPDGVIFSNGPGDPSAVPYAVETVRDIIGKVPVFGICMGHQLLGQALGGKTFKMKFGHHEGNHPVRNLRKNLVEISAQVCLLKKLY
ncbi:carbamoyl-phosphate synthase small chain, chloroplastic-like [Cornus florida]|uniref:carbamoyl-phosphate synthase small chain, chloroplastic-like n=1 Tax=Cornus florida TaxID=4283 RepID=UPI0028A1BF53|nr:carbamoyl-phosphate synthase small chain, chloroplastic-like [Cornus florida]